MSGVVHLHAQLAVSRQQLFCVGEALRRGQPVVATPAKHTLYPFVRHVRVGEAHHYPPARPPWVCYSGEPSTTWSTASEMDDISTTTRSWSNREGADRNE